MRYVFDAKKLKKTIKFLGFLIILCGFLVPFLSEGRLQSIYFFWVGFLLLLWPSNYPQKVATWMKWARIGLSLHVIGSLLLLFFGDLIANTSLQHNNFNIILLKIASMLVNPISTIVDFLLPHEKVEIPAGGIHYTISFLRVILTSFSNVLVYIISAVMLGKLISKKV